MKEKDVDFTQQMIEQVNESLPAENVVGRHPWSEAIGFITWGFFLTTFNLNFIYLQYILPTIGSFLIFGGFRSLRNENKYFKMAWILSLVTLFKQLASLVVISTPLNTGDYPNFAIKVVVLAFQLAIFMVFHKALSETFKKAGKAMEKEPLLWLALWTVGAFFLALSPLSKNWLVVIFMVISYIGILISLYSVGNQLDDEGCILATAPVKISNRTLGWAYFLLTLVTVITCSAFYNHLKLEPQEYYPPSMTEGRQNLLELGFPAQALMYLSNQDVKRLDGALDVESFSKLLMFDPKKVEHVNNQEGYTYITHSYQKGKKNIQVTTVFIEMPKNVVYVMQYFTWEGGKPVWQDGFLISGEPKADDKEIISSGLFFSRDGNNYTAGFPRLVCEKNTIKTMFGISHPVIITGALSYPFGSHDQGGYVLYRYTVKGDSGIYYTEANFSYVHLSSPVHLPYQNTEDLMLRGAFAFYDELQQHFTTYGSVAVRERNSLPR